MPQVLKAAYVQVYYQLQCSFERAEALAQDTMRVLKDDPGICGAEDVTNGFDVGVARVRVDYDTFEDAIRLDGRVRELLSRKVDYTYDAHLHTTYGSRGAHGYVTASTTVTERAG